MAKKEYHYYILKERWLARAEKGKGALEEKEFYKDGKWVHDDKLNLRLNDCIMDYGDSKWYEYDDVSEEEANAFIDKMQKENNE